MSDRLPLLRRSKWTLLVLLFLTSGACVPLDDAMAAIFGRSMRDQRSFDPYENTQQNALLPPEGAVPFASGNMAAGPFEVNLGQAEGATDVPAPFTQLDMVNDPALLDGLVNPVPASAESLARGEELYTRICSVCHGPDGAGTTGNIYEVHPAMAAYPLRGERALAYSDGYLYGMVRVGRGLMPPYGHQVGHYDRWHIVNYVRQIQSGAGN